LTESVNARTLGPVQRKNPFPGINPWMQLVWSDVHTRLIGHIAEALGEELPADLVARAEERVVLNEPDDGERVSKADVAMVEPESWRHGRRAVWTPVDDPGLADRLAMPIIVKTDDVTPRWLEIRTARGRLITVIEVASPANKTQAGRAAFERKRDSFVAAGVNFMEIDLIRGGQSVRHARSGEWPTEPCLVVANRALDPNQSEVYPCALRLPLPAVAVPLRQGEPDAALDLQPLIDRCYAKGRYWLLPYDEEPPALDQADLVWAQAVVRDAGLA